MTAGNTGTVPNTGAVTNGADDPVELVIGGMSCASCAARVEKRLNRLDGVTAAVSYATERAYVTSSGGRDPDELISAVKAAGYTAALPPHAGGGGADKETSPPAPQTRALARRLAVCVPLAVPVVILSMIPAAQFPGWQWVSLALAAPVAAWGALPLHRAAWAGLGHAAASMDTLVSLGVITSFAWSLYALLAGGAGRIGMRMPFAFTFGTAGPGTLYLDVAAWVTVAVLTGRYLESRAKDRCGAAIASLASLGARTVAVLRDGEGQHDGAGQRDGVEQRKGVEQRVSVDELKAGELFIVRPGEKIAADGVVVEGSSAVDGSLLTGESMPAEVGPGDAVTGATINMGGRLIVRATGVGAATRLAQMNRLVSQALTSKAGAQHLADRIAAVFVPCVISLAVATLGFWLGAGLQAQAAWSAAVAVLVVACPCALGLATATAMLAAVGRGAELGILIKNMQALESARSIRAVVFDKTGTLTTGRMTLHAIITAVDPAMGGIDEKAVLRAAGAVEDASEHPVGQVIAREATARLGPLPPVTGFTSLAGAGVRGTVDITGNITGDSNGNGTVVTVGSPRLMEELSMTVPPELLRAVDTAEDASRTAVLAAWDGQARGVLVLADALKPGAEATVASVRCLGLRSALLTGDNERTARAIAAQLAIPQENVFAGVRPEGKVAVVRSLQADGYPVAVVGDGVNDAAALAQADLGMAIGTGTDAAIGAADLTLTVGDPRAIAEALLLARMTLRVIRVNLGWAFGYNVIAIPLAALGYLNPLFAGTAMAASSLIVVSNSLRLRRFHTRPSPPWRLPPGAEPGSTR
jgi:Cu+-exporting ATPase